MSKTIVLPGVIKNHKNFPHNCPHTPLQYRPGMKPLPLDTEYKIIGVEYEMVPFKDRSDHISWIVSLPMKDSQQPVIDLCDRN